MLLRTCAAPGPYIATNLCGREFVPTCDHQLYCSRKCAARAHRNFAKENRKKREAGLPVPTRGFPTDAATRLLMQHLASGGSVPANAVPEARAAPTQSVITPSDIANEVHRLEELDKLTAAAASQEIFEKLGYLRPGATTGVEPGSHPKPEPDRSAEPQTPSRFSSEDEAPDFRDTIDDADAPLDYPETDDL